MQFIENPKNAEKILDRFKKIAKLEVLNNI